MLIILTYLLSFSIPTPDAIYVRYQSVVTICFTITVMKVNSMQRSGTEAIRTQIQPSKPKREITNITNSQNKKITYGQPSEQLVPKRWPLSSRNRTKNNMNTHKVKFGHQKQATENHNKTTALERSVMNNWGRGLSVMKLYTARVSTSTVAKKRRKPV